MQGSRGAIGSFTETLGFEHGSTSSEPSLIDHQICWENNLQNSPSDDLSDYIALDSRNEEGQDLSHPGSSFEAYRGSSSSSSSFPEPYELDDRNLSRKRKAVELSIGQSSSEPPLVANTSVTRSDEIIPRLGLSVGTASLEDRHEGRNVQPRITSSRQQDPLPSLRLNPVDLRSPSLGTTSSNLSSHQGQGQDQDQPFRSPALRRNSQPTSRWSRNSSSRANRTSFNLVVSGDRNELGSISDHPLFFQSNNPETELHWNSNSSSDAGNGVAAAASRAGPSSGSTLSSAAPNSAAHRTSPHYNPQRLSAFLRDLESGGGQNGNLLPRIPPLLSSRASASHDLGIPPAVGVQAPHPPHSRSPVLLGRQLDGAFGFPRLSRASGREGRGRLVSEIRNVLDIMRRGEPLRFEDLMILDQSVFYGIADMHDRHRDMRLDIDNMSYEELLALEDRIGNVNTGLTEEAISKHLKQKQYVTETGQPDPEPCCICQEEYNDGDDLGTLECGHEFHCGCIKQWLQHKNLCPVCKSTGFAAT